jgi:hypothetical protein
MLMAKMKLVVSNICWALLINISLSYLTFLLNNERVLYLVLYYTQVYNAISLF